MEETVKSCLEAMETAVQANDKDGFERAHGRFLGLCDPHDQEHFYAWSGAIRVAAGKPPMTAAAYDAVRRVATSEAYKGTMLSVEAEKLRGQFEVIPAVGAMQQAARSMPPREPRGVSAARDLSLP